MSWNYRLMAHENNNEYYFNIHDVYYDTKGTPKSYSENPAVVGGSDINEVIYVMNKFKSATLTPILWYGDRFPEVFDYDRKMKGM